LIFYRLTLLDLRRQKLVEQSLNLVRRVQEMKIATTEWKSNLTNLSVGESGLTIDSSNALRERVTKISQEVKTLEEDMKTFVNQMYKLQDLSRNFDREIKSLQLSVQDASRVCHTNFFIRFVRIHFFRKLENYLQKSIKLNIKLNVR
jgi:predicted nuclease with TOPRIM domain